MLNFIFDQFKKQKKDSVHQLLDIFYVKEYQENTNITSHTKKHAYSIIKNLKILIESSVNLNDLNYSFVEDLKGVLQEKYSQTYARGNFTIFKRFLNWVYLCGYTNHEIKYNGVISQRSKKDILTVTPQQIEYFKKKIKEALKIDLKKEPRRLQKFEKNSVLKLYYSILFLYETGVRLQELSRIKRTDFNAKKSELFIKSFAKNKGASRVIILNKTAKSLIESMPQYDDVHLFLFPFRTTVLFNNYFQNFMRSDYSTKQKFKLSSLRKAFITESLKSGVPLETVSKYVGHSRSTITSAYYVDVQELNSTTKAHWQAKKSVKLLEIE